MKNNFKKAFSLIEISIVILIVGILIAGISKGIDMVYDMRLVTARALTDKSPVGSIENLEMWLETTSENSLATGTASFTDVKNPNDSDPIGRWNDINPTPINPNFKNHAVQNTLSFQPLYIKDGINGLPALQFDGFDDFLGATDGRTNFNEFTIFLVIYPKFKSNADSNYSNIINISCSGTTACRNLSSSTGYLLSYAGGNPSAWISINYNATTPTTSANPGFSYMQSREINPGGTLSSDIGYAGYGFYFSKQDIARIAYVNHGSAKVNVFMSSQTKSSANSLPLLTGNSYLDFRIGTQKGNGGTVANRNYKGFIGEIILFGRSLNNQESQLIENYLSEKWRIKL